MLSCTVALLPSYPSTDPTLQFFLVVAGISRGVSFVLDLRGDVLTFLDEARSAASSSSSSSTVKRLPAREVAALRSLDALLKYMLNTQQSIVFKPLRAPASLAALASAEKALHEDEDEDKDEDGDGANHGGEDKLPSRSQTSSGVQTSATKRPVSPRHVIEKLESAAAAAATAAAITGTESSLLHRADRDRWEVILWITGKEAVHAVRSVADVFRRVGGAAGSSYNRACYGLFHPAMPRRPLVFIEIALTHGLAGRVDDILDGGGSVDGQGESLQSYRKGKERKGKERKG